RIARSPKCERRKVAGELVMAVAVGGRSRKTRCNDHRAIEADGSDHITEDLALAPHSSCLVAGFRKSVVHRPGEELFAAVKSTRLEKFFRANYAEGLREFIADHILAAVAACEREVRRACLLVPG